MHWVLRRIVLLVTLMTAVAASTQAVDWADYATVSMTDPLTPKLSANRLCYSDGRDLLCDGAAGLLTTSGTLQITNVSTTGNVSAQKFIGDGSALTGISTQGDRITSGTTSLIAISNTGFVSLTQAGTNTGWFNPTLGLVTIGVSSTGVVSSTGNYIGASTSNGYLLDMFAPNLASIRLGAGYQNSFIQNNYGTLLIGNNTRNVGFDTYDSYGTASQIKFNGSNIEFNVTSVADYTNATVNWTKMLNVTPLGTGVATTGTPSATLHVTGNARITSWTYINGNSTPTTALEVSGTVSATRFVGDGSGLTGISTQGDRITSGTASAIANSAGGYISLTTGSNTWGYLGSSATYLPNLNTGNISASIVSVTNISATTGTFSSSVQFGGTGAEACSSAADYGKTRKNPTSGRIQVCNAR